MEKMVQVLLKRETYQGALAEFVGTGLLTLAALLAGTPYAVALILAALVYALGPVSGAHLNPAVTLGLLAARRLPPMTAVLYLDAQALGALLAARLAPAIGDVANAHRSGRPIGEFVGAGLLVLTVVAVSDKWVPKAGAGVAIGAALGAGLLLSGGVLNPAVAVAMNLGRAPAMWAPALGGVAFALLFGLLSAKSSQEEDKGEDEGEDKVEEVEDGEIPALTKPGGASRLVFPTADRNIPAAQALRADLAGSDTPGARAPRTRVARPADSGRARLARALGSSLLGMMALPLALAGPAWRLFLRSRQSKL